MGSTNENGSAPRRATPDNDAPEDRRFRSELRREAVGEALGVLRAVIRGGSFSLFDLLSVFVEDAVERGWIEVGKDGYARASIPDRRFESMVPEDAADRWKKIAALREKHHASVLYDVAALTQRMADDRELNALNAALRAPEVQHAALSSLAVAFVEPGVFEAMQAGALAADLAMVANGAGNGVPEAMLSRVLPFVSRLHDDKVATWEAALMLGLRTAMASDGDARKRVELTLRFLRVGASEAIPAAFLKPSASQITKATALLRTLQLATLKAEFRPARPRNDLGAPMSDRGAAAAFAKCFAVPFEPKASRTKRRKT